MAAADGKGQYKKKKKRIQKDQGLRADKMASLFDSSGGRFIRANANKPNHWIPRRTRNGPLHCYHIVLRVFSYNPSVFCRDPDLPLSPHRRFTSSLPMSASIQSARPSIGNSTSNFNSASNEYRRVTGCHLGTHPFATQLGACDNPGVILSPFVLKNSRRYLRQSSTRCLIS